MKYAYLTPVAYDKPMLPDVVTVKRAKSFWLRYICVCEIWYKINDTYY